MTWRAFKPDREAHSHKRTISPPTPAKVAKPAKLDLKTDQNTQTLATLAALAVPQDRFYELEERAAIIEFDGGFTRSKAELLAAQEASKDK